MSASTPPQSTLEKNSVVPTSWAGPRATSQHSSDMRHSSASLPLSLLSLVIVHLWSDGHASALDITWEKPSAGDVYVAGSYIVGQWQSSAANISTLSFSLCSDEGQPDDAGAVDGADVNCGSAIQPAVVPGDDDNSYQVTLSAPEVLQLGNYLLQMVAESGESSFSPVFSLQPGDLNSTTSNAPSTPTLPNDDTGSSRNVSKTSPRALSNMPQARSPASTAAYAVPLSLAGAIILVASVLCVHQRRKLLHERAVNHEESKTFQTLFNGGRWRSFSTRIINTVHRAARPTMDRVPEEEKTRDAEDYFTRAYVPHLPKGTRARAATKEPFHVSPTGRSTVPAAYFRAALSPRVPHSACPSPGVDRDCRSQALGTRAGEMNALVNDGVVSRYLQPSPIPRSASQAPARIPQAHVRQQACAPATVGGDADELEKLYEEVARRLA